MANILIVDDDADYLKVFQDSMTEMGHSVEVLHGPKSVVSLVQKNPGKFDVIFLDFIMPGGGGVSTLHKLRAVDRDVSVVVITGHMEAVQTPLFTMGLNFAQAKVAKTTPLSQLHQLVCELTHASV